MTRVLSRAAAEDLENLHSIHREVIRNLNICHTSFAAWGFGGWMSCLETWWQLLCVQPRERVCEGVGVFGELVATGVKSGNGMRPAGAVIGWPCIRRRALILRTA